MSQDLFTAAAIAAALQRPKRSVLAALERTQPGGTKIVRGNEARAWSKDALPQSILTALEDAAAQRKTNVEALLAAPRPIWRPRYPLRELTNAAIERASLLQRSLARSLARLNDSDLSAAEFERLGVEDYRRTFGHSVSTRHWRRLVKRTLDRDCGTENWGRLEIYLDESPARRPQFRRRNFYTPVSLQPLQELIASFEDLATPTELEKDCLWIYAFEHFEQESQRCGKRKAIKRATLKFLYENATFLGKSGKGIKVQFDRKLKRWDRRRARTCGDC